MKSERRHELQHNELADWMVKWGEVIKPYANVILGGILLIAIIAVGWTVMAKKSHANATHAWEDFYVALSNGSFAELDNVAEHYPGSDAAYWAKVVVGDLRLAEGCNELFTSRAGANQELNKAIDHYDAVLEKCSNEAIRQRATFGLARAHEAQGSLDKAIDNYKKLLKPENAYTATAETRITALEKPSTKQFYDRFAKFDPKPAFRNDLPGPLPLDNLDNLKLPGPDESMFPQYDPVLPKTEPSTGTDDTTTTEPAAPSTEEPTANEPAAPTNAKDDKKPAEQ